MKRAKRSAALAVCMAMFGVVGIANAAAAESFGITEFSNTYEDPAGAPMLQAGSHADLRTAVAFNKTESGTVGTVRDVEVDLPAGFSGNPEAIQGCSQEEILVRQGVCNPAAQIGLLELGGIGEFPLYRMNASDEQTAVLAAIVLGVPAKIVVSARTDGDYGLTARAPVINEAITLSRLVVTLWGVPYDEVHDPDRYKEFGFGGAHIDAAPKPFLSLPSRCEPMITEVHADSWQNPGPYNPNGSAKLSDPRWSSASAESPRLTGCEALDFPASLKARPTTNAADSPSGLDLDLNIPQNADDPQGLSPANLRNVEVTLPEGLVINPSGANGLGACTLQQIGFSGRDNERQFLRFDPNQTNAFAASFGGQSTAPILASAGVSEVTAALEALPGLAGNIVLQRAPGGWIVTFTGALAGTDVPSFSGSVTDNSAQKLEVTGDDGSFNLHYEGVGIEATFDATNFEPALPELIEITNWSRVPREGEAVEGPGIEPGTVLSVIVGNPDVGFQAVLSKPSTETLSGAHLNTALPFDSSAQTIQEALQGIPALGAGNVLVTSTGTEGTTRSFNLLFTGDLAGTNPTITAKGSLIGPGAGVTFTPVASEPHPLEVATIADAGPPHFDKAKPTCPDNSRIGRVEVDTPAFPEPLKGSVYAMTPYDNPFNSLLGIYFTVEGHGIIAKIPAQVSADPQTGRLTNVVTESPQLPIENVRLKLDGGAAGVLRTPTTCGTYATTTKLTPWSYPATPIVNDKDSWAIAKGASNQGCASSEAQLPNTPAFQGGSVSPIAGAYKPFVVNLKREDGSQQFAAVTLTPPPGLVAKLKGTAICSDGALAAAAAKSGNAEKASPSCSAASAVGNVYAQAGAGPAPFNAPGTVYLAGPYKGAPLSLATVIPATAGPFDLGTVVTRIAVRIDPATAKITASSDPLPTILKGIPLNVRSVSVRLDKPDFSLNPTSCDPMAVKGTLLSTTGAAAALDNRFQLAECGRLGFKPSLKLSVKGGAKRGKYQALRAVLTNRPGDANIASVQVALPHSEFLAQEHIKTICTRVQWAADACPKASIYGKVSVVTPLLDYPLTGNVYLRSSSNPLPDLVPDLRGPASQPIRFESAGKTDSINEGLRNTFSFVPDVPFTKLTLQLQGGKKGLLVNSRNICKSINKADVNYTAHNGASYSARPVLKAQCGKKARKGGGKGKKGKGANRR